MSHSQNSRRVFLRSGSGLVALPFLESFGFRRFASASENKTSSPAKRMVFISMGFGPTMDSWFPAQDDVGYNYKIPKVLKPLEKHKDGLTLIQNTMHKFSKDGHSGSTFWLTGANRYAIAGQSFHNTISVDQVAAEVMGKATRYTSMQFDSSEGGDGHGPGLSLSWDAAGRPIAGIKTPLAAYNKLFSESNMSLEERELMLKNQQSVLDTVLVDAKSVKGKVSKADSNKIDEYFDSIRGIETRLSKEKKWMNIPKKQPKNPVAVPNTSILGKDAIALNYDIMLAAMQVDASRVFSYRLPADALLQSFNAPISAHNMSHYTYGERRDVSEERDRLNASLISKFVDKMKATKESDGSSLFDNMTLAFGGNLSKTHSLHNCPTLVMGGGSGFKHGRHLCMENPKYPLCNVWLSILRGSGINVKSHGDSTGVLEELFTS